MAAFRFIAWMILAIAIALLGADAISSIEAGQPVVRTTAEIIGLAGVDATSISSASPGGVSSALSTVFSLPLWGILGIIGVILTLIFRPID